MTEPTLEQKLLARPDLLTVDELMQLALGVPPGSVAELQKKYGDSLRSTFELAHVLKVPAKKRTAFVAAVELANREKPKALNAELSDPRQAYQLLIDMRNQAKEHFVALYLNARNRLIHRETVSIGTLTASLVHPREVFSTAVKVSAAGMIVAHNHPSGDARPSPEDRAATRRLERAGRIIGIPMLDHIIVSENGYYSFREDGGLV